MKEIHFKPGVQIVIKPEGDVVVGSAGHPDGIGTLRRVLVRVRDEDRAVRFPLRIKPRIGRKSRNGCNGRKRCHRRFESSEELPSLPDEEGDDDGQEDDEKDDDSDEPQDDDLFGGGSRQKIGGVVNSLVEGNN